MSVFGVRKVPTNTLPRPSTATHSAPEAHETSSRFASSTSVVRHAEGPPLGLVAVTTLPPLSATHSDRVGQETPPNAKGGAPRVLHAALPPGRIGRSDDMVRADRAERWRGARHTEHEGDDSRPDMHADACCLPGGRPAARARGADDRAP